MYLGNGALDDPFRSMAYGFDSKLLPPKYGCAKLLGNYGVVYYTVEVVSDWLGVRRNRGMWQLVTAIRGCL